MQYSFKVEKELQLIPEFIEIYRPNLKIHTLKPVVQDSGILFKGIADDVFQYVSDGGTKPLTKFLLYNFSHLISLEGLNPGDVEKIEITSVSQEFKKTEKKTVKDIIKICCNIIVSKRL